MLFFIQGLPFGLLTFKRKLLLAKVGEKVQFLNVAGKIFVLINCFFLILWKSRCDILVSFPSHLKKLRSILRFWLEKLNCGFFHSFHSRKTPQNNFSSQNFSVENNYLSIELMLPPRGPSEHSLADTWQLSSKKKQTTT